MESYWSEIEAPFQKGKYVTIFVSPKLYVPRISKAAIAGFGAIVETVTKRVEKCMKQEPKIIQTNPKGIIRDLEVQIVPEKPPCRTVAVVVEENIRAIWLTPEALWTNGWTLCGCWTCPHHPYRRAEEDPCSSNEQIGLPFGLGLLDETDGSEEEDWQILSEAEGDEESDKEKEIMETAQSLAIKEEETKIKEKKMKKKMGERSVQFMKNGTSKTIQITIKRKKRNIRCFICRENHKFRKCPEIQKMLNKRRQQINEKRTK